MTARRKRKRFARDRMNARAQWCLLARVKQQAGEVGRLGKCGVGRSFACVGEGSLSGFRFLLMVVLGRLVGVAASA